MLTLAFLRNIGPLEALIIVALFLLLFSKRIPEAARGIGRGIVEFKRGLKDHTDDLDQRPKQ